MPNSSGKATAKPEDFSAGTTRPGSGSHEWLIGSN